MCKEIIAIANQKGGVGKTTITANLGIGIARTGKRVLLIDADPQANLTVSLGFDENNLNGTLADVLDKQMSGTDIEEDYGILHHEEGVDLLPTDIALAESESKLLGQWGGLDILRGYIETVSQNYDYILIDCLPSLGRLALNVLYASTSVMIPVKPEKLPVQGLEQLISNIVLIQRKQERQHIKPIRLDGVVFSLVDRRTGLAKRSMGRLRSEVPFIRYYESYIPYLVAIAETVNSGGSIFTYAPGTDAARSFEALTEEVLHNEK